MAALSNPASQSVLGEDPLGKLKSHMTEVMVGASRNFHFFEMFLFAYFFDVCR